MRESPNSVRTNLARKRMTSSQLSFAHNFKTKESWESSREMQIRKVDNVGV